MRWKLRVVLTSASLLAMGAASTASAQSEACSGKNAKMSKAIAKNIGAAVEALKVRNWQEVTNQVQEAQANPAPKTAYDEFWIHKLLGNANAGLKEYKSAAKELELITASPCMTAMDLPDHLKLLTQLYYQEDDFPKVFEHGNRLLAMGPNPEMALYIGQAYYLTKNFPEARRLMQEVVAQAEAEGKPPGEQDLRIIHGACVALADDACATLQYEKLVQFYPKPEYWNTLVLTLFYDKQSTDRQQLNVMRLARYVGVAKEPSRFEEIAQIALDQGLPGEAQSLIEEAMAKNLFKDKTIIDRNNRLLARAKAAAAEDKASLAQQDNAAKANASGNADVKIGAAFLSYGDDAKAIEALQRGLSKGGVRDPDEAGLMLGIAYLRTGNKAEAAKAFNTVKDNAMMTRLAKLWLLTTST